MPSGIEVGETSQSYSHRGGIERNGSNAGSTISTRNEIRKTNSGPHHRTQSQSEEEGVEVVLGESSGTSKVIERPPESRTPEQSIFRHSHPVRPRAVRAPPTGPPPPPRHHHHHPHPNHPPQHHHHHHHHPPPPPPPPSYLHGSGSWGYGPPPPHVHSHPDYPPPPPPSARPYPVPPYNSSASFEESYAHHHHTPHYSPHIQYPPHGRRHPAEEVNVISPNHKTDPHYRPPLTPRPRHLPHSPSQGYYQYPPTSPVSRPEDSPPPPSYPPSSGPPRLRNYAMRRGTEGAYARAQRSAPVEHHLYHPDDGTWNPYPPAPLPSTSLNVESSRPHPTVVAESFDSEHQSQKTGASVTTGGTSHPPSPPPPVSAEPPPPPTSSEQPPGPHDPHYHFYGGGASWGSFDSAAPPPPHHDDRPPYGFPPDSPYSPYTGVMYSPGGIYPSDSFPPPPPPPSYGSTGPPAPPTFSYSYDDDERLFSDYHPEKDHEDLKHVTPPGNSKPKGRSKTPVSSNTSNRNMILPKAAEEIDFDVTDPPLEPILPPSEEPVCESLADVNSYDVLCGRGGGTNSQIGNRRFRKLVQEFQPTYLMAKRKEKPLLARTIVLIIRKRGGRFLKKHEETGEMFEVGDSKAEAKTSQALREGLDVRATKSAGNSLVDKKKKKKSTNGKSKDEDEDDEEPEEDSPRSTDSEKKVQNPRPPESPPTLPRLQGEEKTASVTGIHPHSPEPLQGRKRRRMRSIDRFFPDFCPPRADLGRTASPMPDDLEEDDDVLDMSTTPIRRNNSVGDDDSHYRYSNPQSASNPGCAGIALDMMTGAATGSFCLAPSGWRRR